MRVPTLAASLAAIATLIGTGMTGSASAAPATRVPAADRAVTFVVDGTTTYGTLHVPAHRTGQRLAAALLLPGSGPTDRNGDQPPRFVPHTLARIADLLDAQGIMSLRFDKYGTGQTGLGAYAGRLATYDYPAQIRQADAAYGLLRDQPEADRQALLVLGHSEGGLSAILVAESARPRPAGVAMLNPLDLRWLDMYRLQLDAQLDHAVAIGLITQAVADQNKAGINRTVAQFRAGQPVDMTGLLPGIVAALNTTFNPTIARYARSIDAIYPPAAAQRLAGHTRALATCGTADPQVPCFTTPPLAAALRRAGSTGPGLRSLPNVDHELRVADTSGNDELAPATIAALSVFTAPWQIHLPGPS